MDKIELASINRMLDLKWGGRPLFRVVDSETELEVRARVHRQFDNSGNYLGERAETWRFRKYPSFRHCYILEKDVREQGCPPEVKDWNGYEMIWPFQKPNSEEPIDPNVEVCMFITESLMNGVKRTLKDYYDEEKKAFDKEVQETYDLLENESPYIATMLQNKEAIVVPDMKGKNNAD